MTYTDEFHDQYRAALLGYLETRNEDSLAVGHELGRRALQEQISMLDIIENTFWLLDDLSRTAPVDRGTALEFVLQTLAPLDVATRGFIDGTRRYAQERARAEDLADRDRFRTALVNSLQEGFFVADEHGAVVEVNNAFADILGYGEDGLPYTWPQPWLVDREGTYAEQQRVREQGSAEYEIPVRHQDGHLAWVAVSINAVRGPDGGPDVYVGTIRDVTARRAFAARESAVMRLATSVSVAKSVAEVLEITLEESRAAVDVRRVVAVMWPSGDGEPTVVAAGDPPESNWRTMAAELRGIFQDARHQLPLTAKTVEWPESPGKARGLVAMLSGAGDVALWLELASPRWVSAEDKLLVTMLIGHLSLAIQHVRQFEAARVTSLTLQRAMLPPMQPPRVSRCGTSPRSRRWRSAVTGTTYCRSTRPGSASLSATAWAGVAGGGDHGPVAQFRAGPAAHRGETGRAARTTRRRRVADSGRVLHDRVPGDHRHRIRRARIQQRRSHAGRTRQDRGGGAHRDVAAHRCQFGAACRAAQ